MKAALSLPMLCPLSTGHLHGPHPTLALARPGPGPDPPPIAPIPAALPDTARSQAAGPGKSQPADLQTVRWPQASGVDQVVVSLSAKNGRVPGYLLPEWFLSKLHTEEHLD